MAPAPSSLAERRAAYFAQAAAAAATWYDADGKWVADTLPAATRERFWVCFALYAAGNAALADAVIRRGDTPCYGQVRFNIFDTNIAALLLVLHREAMAADVREQLAGLVRDGFSFKPGNRQPDYQFHGYNDNMPAKATMGLVLGGELLGDAGAVEYGLWDLRQFRAMLVRNGTNSEFNSPTYSPLTIHAIAEIAAHARQPEARALALAIEERLWLDLAARFHPELGLLSGPYARAYTIDTIAHLSNAATLLWLVLGDRARPSPLVLFERPADLVVHHEGDYPFNIAQMCWYVSGSYHVPAAAEQLFCAKTYPFRAVATCEQGDAGPDFPARPCRLETWLQPDFALGTSSTSMCGGEQTMSYFVAYRRRSPVKSFRDVGTVFTKLVINDEVPGTIHSPEDGGRRWANSGEGDCLTSHANTVTMQSEATALVLTHPHLSLGGEADTGANAKPLTGLSELVIFPSHFGGAEEVLVGGQARRQWAGEVAHGQWIVCRRGRLFIGVRPLAYTRTLGPVRLSLETVNHYEVIRATFYRGAARPFMRQELRHVLGGFVAEHAGADEYNSLQSFAADLAEARFTDYFWTTRRVRYRRPRGTARPPLELEISLSPGSQWPRHAVCNGRPLAWPAVQIDGLGPEDLPFLNEPFQPVPPFFPWADFRVEWGDWPWAIGDREQG